MPTPTDLEREHTLLTAAARYDDLRRREIAASVDDDTGSPLGRDAALELLALSEAISRKAGYGRQLTVRRARTAGASWAQIGDAMGVSRQAAWEGHSRWIEQQVAAHERVDHEGMDPTEAASARELAGPDGEA